MSSSSGNNGNVVLEEGEEAVGREEPQNERYPVASWNFKYVSTFLVIALWILLGSFAKIGFNLHKKVTRTFPEGCLLITLGLMVGLIYYVTQQKAFSLPSDVLFLVLLPPIIFEAGYFMPNRPFFDNIGTILLFAIVNTLFNAALIGLTLWAFNFTPIYGGVDFGILDCFVFASGISATDPVAVIVTFLEVNVNNMLYIIVFGEALLNDGVSAVLYRLFSTFSAMGIDNIKPVDTLLGVASFFFVSLGGVFIGVLVGVIASFTTKFTRNTPILEPLVCLIYAYLSYIVAELFSTSGILSITFCGMFMKQFVEQNVDKRSNSTIEYVIKMLATIMETVIFIFMGVSTISDEHAWNTGFVLVSIFACFVYRVLGKRTFFTFTLPAFFISTIGVFLFSWVVNKFRLHTLKFSDMAVLSYSGIRGGIAFTLASILDESKVPRKKELVTATIAVVFFTVFIQGSTIGPLVRYLKIKRQEEAEQTMNAKLTTRLIDHVMTVFEDINGVTGNHSLRNRVRKLDKRVLKRVLLRSRVTSRDHNLMSKFKKVNEFQLNQIAEQETIFINRQPTISSVSLRAAADSREQTSKRIDEDAKLHRLLDISLFNENRLVYRRSQLNQTEADEESPQIEHNDQQYPRYKRPIYPRHQRTRHKSSRLPLRKAAVLEDEAALTFQHPPPPWQDSNHHLVEAVKSNAPLTPSVFSEHLT